MELGQARGAGFVFTADDPYCGIDLDNCVDEQGKVHPAATELVRKLNGYTETSPSGSGLHIIIEAQLTGKRHATSKTPWGGKLEVYDRGRFFTVHGQGQGLLADRQAALDEVVARWLPPKERTPKTPVPAQQSSTPDAELLDRAFRARNGAKFRRLWEGDTSGYPSHSEADAALCCLLAFWTSDPERIDRLFRQSGLVRDKWDRDDYRCPVADSAISLVDAGRVTVTTEKKEGKALRARAQLLVPVGEKLDLGSLTVEQLEEAGGARWVDPQMGPLPEQADGGHRTVWKDLNRLLGLQRAAFRRTNPSVGELLDDPYTLYSVRTCARRCGLSKRAAHQKLQDLVRWGCVDAPEFRSSFDVNGLSILVR
jgi:hypothetical protein